MSYIYCARISSPRCSTTDYTRLARAVTSAQLLTITLMGERTASCLQIIVVGHSCGTSLWAAT